MKTQTFLSTCFLLAINLANAQDWSLTGNSGTTPGSNFVGTKDNKALIFKVNNQFSGSLSADPLFGNTVFGYQALMANFAGKFNAGFGYQALYTNQTGTNNAVLGYQSLFKNTRGGSNTATGASSLYNNATGAGNTASGYSSLYNNLTGSRNTAAGLYSLYGNTTGYSNVAVGAAALYRNKAGHNLVAIGDSALFNQALGQPITDVDDGDILGYLYENTAVGSKSLYSNINGASNTGVGYKSLSSNNSGSNNTALGANTLMGSTASNSNTAVGAFAMYGNTGSSNTAVGMYANSTGSGSHNVSIGNNALSYSSSAQRNVAVGTNVMSGFSKNASGNVGIGFAALYRNSSNNNVAIGDSSLYRNSAGASASVDGIYNTAVGSRTMTANTIGHSNTAIGYSTLQQNTTGARNLALGTYALQKNTTGKYNVSVGNISGNFNDNNNYCTFLGYDADQAVTTDFMNSMALGYASRISGNNQVRIGNNDIQSIGGKVMWSTLSDARYKKDIRENVPGLEFINKLTPITYHLDVPGISKTLKEYEIDENDDTKTNKAAAEEDKTLYTGFAAQEVEKTAKSINYDFNGVDAPKNKDDLYGIRYSAFVVPLVKAVQELSAENKELKVRLEKLEALLKNTPGVNTQQSLNLSNASIDQNMPNPFSQSTVIGYNIPAQFSKAQIVIHDTYGKILKQVTVSGRGKLTVDGSTLAAGAYSYSLVLNGKARDTKKMLISR